MDVKILFFLYKVKGKLEFFGKKMASLLI